MDHADPTVKMAGQVGSQIKIRVGQTWLLANIRTQKIHEGHAGVIVAQVDFLGEGDEERLTGHIYNFRRGVTRYPTPGSVVYAVTTADLKQVYASDGRANVENRYGLSNRRYSRCALCRCHAGQALSRCSVRPVPVNRHRLR